MTSTEQEFAIYDTPEFRAQTAVDRGIRDIVARTSGPGAFHEEPMFEGAATTHVVPDAAASIRAAIMIRDRVNYELDSLIRKARGEGSTWDGIAVLLGFVDSDEQDNSPAERAFYFVAPEIQFQSSTTSWKCSGCGERIIDRGPFESHPEDNERGHRGFEEDKPGEKCPRQAAAVAAWKKRNNW
jgi:hypothetical protein